MRSLRPALVVVLGLAAVPSSGFALGLPPVFPRTIAITGTRQDLRVSDWQIATAPEGGRMRVRIRVGAATVSGRFRHYDLAIAPCTGGPPTSPRCRPERTVRLTFGRAARWLVRSFVVARPSPRRDAVRVTLNRVGSPSVWQPTHVGGGGGSGELLLNGGTWRYRSGTWWGIAGAEHPGVVLDQVKFNSRTYSWTGTSTTEQRVTTTIGYSGAPPRWTFQNTMRAALPFTFHRTPADPIQKRRTHPRPLTFEAKTAAGPLFTLTLPLPAWAGQ